METSYDMLPKAHSVPDIRPNKRHRLETAEGHTFLAAARMFQLKLSDGRASSIMFTVNLCLQG